MAGTKRWLVRSLWLMLIGIPLAGVALYALNPQGARTADPRERILGYAPYRMPSTSMIPALKPGQVAIVRAGTAGLRDLRRGDMVTFRPPNDADNTWVKRIVGLPGETLAIRNGQLLIDGRVVEEPYVLPENARNDYSLTFPATKIPAGHYFLLGDYRDNSEDSRMLSAIPARVFTGKVVQVL